MKLRILILFILLACISFPFQTLALATPSGIASASNPSMMEVKSLTLPEGESELVAAVIDPTTGFAYFGSRHSPGVVVKVRLSDFTRMGALTLGPEDLSAAVIDPTAGYAYFGTRSYPGKVVRVQLSDFTVAGTLTLDPGEDFIHCAVIDQTAGFAYFGLYTQPGKVLKVRLADFTVAGVLTMNAGENNFTSAVIDPGAGFAYFGTGSNVSPGKIVKVRLADFIRIDSLSLSNSDEMDLTAALIDPAAGFAYFGTGYLTNPAKVIKIRLSDFSRVSALTFEPGDAGLYLAALIYPEGDRAYFGTWTSPPGKVVQIRLSDFTRVDQLTLSAGAPLGSAVMDPTGTYAYFATGDTSGKIMKVSLLATKVMVPLISKPPVELTGKVTVNGAPAPGVALDLRFYDGSSWSTKASTTTLADGSYSFLNVPALAAGQSYYIRYLNTSDPSRVYTWHSGVKTTYTATNTESFAPFDIANIELVKPDAGATVGSPATFTWTKRPATPSDSYIFELFDFTDGDPYFFTDPPLGYVGSYVLSKRPAGFLNGVYYGWDVAVISPDGGIGSSYWYYYVRFNSVTGDLAEVEVTSGPRQPDAFWEAPGIPSGR